MRDLLLGLLAGFVAAVSYWITFVIMLGREGVGPGDSLSFIGYVIPTFVGGVVVAALVRRSTHRLFGSCVFWFIVVAATVSMPLLTGVESKQSVLLLVATGVGVHIPCVLLKLLLTRIAPHAAQANH